MPSGLRSFASFRVASNSVTSHSSTCVTGGTIRWASLIRCAMVRRTPLSGSRRPASAELSNRAAGAECASTSVRRMRPPGPVPVTCIRSTLRSRASFLTGGIALTASSPLLEASDGCVTTGPGATAAGAGGGGASVRSTRGHLFSDRHQCGANGHHFTRRMVDPVHHPGEGRGDLGRRLVGDHFNERVILGDLLPLLDEPAIDLCFAHALSEVGQLENRHQKSRTL